MREVEPISKEQQTGRVWTCRVGNDPCTRAQPCPSCRGRRNRRKGRDRQAEAARAAGVPKARYSSQMGHEENLRGPVRIEVKAGRQVLRIATLFLAAEKQSNDARPVGDGRPFEMIAMPDGWAKGDGIVLFRLKDLSKVVEAYTEWIWP